MTTALAAISVTLPLAPGRRAIDTRHSFVGFTVRHLGVPKVRGGFDAEIAIGETPGTTIASATVDGASRHAGFEATTEIRRRDLGVDVVLPPGVSTVAPGAVVKVELDTPLIEPAS